MKPEVWEFLQWQVGIGIAFFGVVIAYITLADKRRRSREDERAKLDEARDKAINLKFDNKRMEDEKKWQEFETDNDKKWRSSDAELRALQQQMRALELELARNYTRQDSVEQIFQRFSNSLSDQIKDIKDEVSRLTLHLLEQRSSPNDPSRRR